MRNFDVVNMECREGGWWVAEVEFWQRTSWAGRLLRRLLGHEEPDPYPRALFGGANWTFADTGERPCYDLNHHLSDLRRRLEAVDQARAIGAGACGSAIEGHA